MVAVQTQVLPLEMLAPFTPAASVAKLRELNRKLHSGDYEPADNSHRGVVISLMNAVLGNLDGAVRAKWDGGRDVARHLFTWLVTGDPSTGNLSRGQLQDLYTWFQTPANQDVAVQVVMAAAKNNLFPAVYVQTQMEDLPMTEIPEPEFAPDPAPVAPVAMTAPDANPGEAIASLASHAEAPLSATAKLFDANGIDWLVTVRAGANGAAFVNFLDVLNKAGAYALSHGFAIRNPMAVSPNTAPTAPAPQTVSAHAAAAPVPTMAAPVPAAVPQGNGGNGGGEASFAATELVATVNNGKTYWKVKGGNWSQFGISIWPEVLDAAGLTNLDPMQAYNLNGWTAFYTEDGQGRKKVTRLAH